MQILQILWDRRDFFLTCLAEHIRISLTAIICAGISGILAGILISRHKKLAGVVLGIINVIYDTFDFPFGIFDSFYRNRK